MGDEDVNEEVMTAEDSQKEKEQPETKEEPAVNPLLQKYEEYLEVVSQKPEDFQTWTYLLSAAERLDEMDKVTHAFDMFLQEYPLCYGYWKKYADAAMKHLGIPATIEIYQRGVIAVPYSVDLWTHYLSFKVAKMIDNADDIRATFERAVALVGKDFLSHTLWDNYIQFEQDHGSTLMVTQIYRRVLAIPCKELQQYHEKFLAFSEEHGINDLLSVHELDSCKKQILDSKNAAPSTTVADETIGEQPDTVDADVQMRENGDNVPWQSSENVDRMEEETETDLSDDDVKKRWVQSVTDLYTATQEELNVRKQYENCIKRPYFHVKPLDSVQLQSWWRYIDYIVSCSDQSDTVNMFERCLVPCASYPEFWMRYVQYVESINAIEASNILKRALYIFCKRKSEMYLFAAQFYERHNDLEASKQCLQHVTEILSPGFLGGIVQHGLFEYRRGESEDGDRIFETRIQMELETEGSQIVGCLAIQFAYIQIKKFGKKNKAREVMDNVLETRPELLIVWEGAIQVEELINDDHSFTRIIDLYTRCTEPRGEDEKSLDETDRFLMSRRLLQFLDIHGSAEECARCAARHIKHFGLHSVTPSLHAKRTATEQLNSGTKGTDANSQPSTTAQAAPPPPPPTSSALSDYFAQNPGAQQYAQYYQYAAAAAAGYGSLTGYSG